MRKETLRLEQVFIAEQGTNYLQDFSFHILEGEIVGLLPVDSHGLSMLIKLLKHNIKLEYGFVYYRDQLVNSYLNQSSSNNRIGVVQRKSALVDDLTVVENIFVLKQGFKASFIQTKVLVKQLQPFLEEINVSISALSYIDKLSPFDRLIVEIVKAVVGGCKLIVLRELHTIISEMELVKLHEIIRQYTKKGISFLYISFHLEELSQICDRVAVMDNGRILKILKPDNTKLNISDTYFQLIRSYLRENENTHFGQQIFSINNLHVKNIKGLSFNVSKGECVVLQDIKNCIIDDFLLAITGNRKLENGEIFLDGQLLEPSYTREISIIQEHPHVNMLFSEMSYLDNLIFTMDHRVKGIWRNKVFRKGLKQIYIDQFGEDNFLKSIEELTTVEKYNLVYRRILMQRPSVVFCVQPFRGADMELRMHIFDLLKMLLERKIAVVILAINLADSLTIADKLIRINGYGEDIDVYLKSDFANLPFDAPFSSVYKNK